VLALFVSAALLCLCLGTAAASPVSAVAGKFALGG
jgi:hypothetical protein